MDVTEELHSKNERPLEEQLDLAIYIAARVHRGQKDKQGINYILHPIAVMMAADTLEAKVLAVLHDTIEDSNLTVDYLRKEGFSERIIEALLLLTKKEGEDYFSYLAKLSKNDLALKVKLLDIENNLRKGCPSELKERYEKGLVFLKNGGSRETIYSSP